ncbi:MAG: SurA N-terminal domain-containing protein [Chloracidobacterium sp.]|nr:SurA N-terminal domain-containing protein [Chloracidobacterium sp.]
MQQIDKLKGVRATVQNKFVKYSTAAAIGVFAAFFAACGGPAANVATGGVDPNETAATVNGKVIKMEEVDRAVKQQAQGQESKLSPLELAGARLQVLQNLVEQEVMFQKAEKEATVPTDEEVSAEVNKQKVESRLSAEEFDKQMTAAGLNEVAFRESIKKGLAIKKLVDKVTGRIEVPKDKEITDFFAGNSDLFVKKRGVRLAAIIIDPSNSGQGDTTTNDAEANVKIKEILTKLSQPGSDFASLAREYSEDPSKLQGGDLGYISEEDLKTNFGAQNAAGFMSPQFNVGGVTNVIPLNGKRYIFKLQERIEKEETQTIESPGVRQQINDLLVNNRKQLLAASYQAIAMNEAKIDNLLAKKVVNNPNELSGARPAGSSTPAANANTAAANANTPPAANMNTAANTNANAKPAANAPAKPEAKPSANAPANK